MAVHGGPNIVTDGLVLCLDKYDENSYLGEPTTNVHIYSKELSGKEMLQNFNAHRARFGV